MAPARRTVRAGALFVLALCAACDSVDPDDAGLRVLELAHDTMRLPDGVSLVDVKVRRDTGAGEFEPAEVRAHTGDVVRFTSEDRGGHAIVFDGAVLAADVREYLATTAQLRSPPLIAPDAAWVITLDGAPPGEYTFRCTTHDAAGRLVVASPAA